VTVVLAVLAVPSGGGLSSGEKEDRGNRWVLGAFSVIASRWLSSRRIRSHWALDAGRRRSALGESCAVLCGPAAPYHSGVCIEKSLQRAGGSPAGTSA
jgi:hypothetical protein